MYSKKDLIERLICLNDFEKSHPIKIDLAYADQHHPDNVFGAALYKKDARCWCDKNLAELTLKTATSLKERHNFSLIIKDTLRPVEAQTAMSQTPLVINNPHWLEEPDQLLSKPGAGGHPRGMAIDVELFNDSTQKKCDMGVIFDYFAPDGMPNMAARNVTDFPTEILNNRETLESAFIEAANALNVPLLPLPDEWWDFRLKPDFYNQFPALSDEDLPPKMRMTC